MPATPDLAPWLSCQKTTNTNGSYRHGFVKEDLAYRQAVLPHLKLFIDKVHEEAKEYWRTLLTPSLDPLQQDGNRDPTVGYPSLLPMKTWQGYFGEIMAG